MTPKEQNDKLIEEQLSDMRWMAADACLDVAANHAQPGKVRINAAWAAVHISNECDYPRPQNVFDMNEEAA